MKVLTKHLRASHEALLDLGQIAMPGAIGMRVALAIRAVRDPMGAYGDAFNALLAKHGSPIESKPGQFQVTTEAMPAFAAEADELDKVEVEVAIAEKIPAAAFEKIDVKPATLAALEWLIQL